MKVIFQEISTLQKDLEDNNLNTDNIINDTKDNNKDKLDSLSIKENQKSEENTKNLKLNNDNNKKLRKTNSLMMKPSSSIYNINENIDIVQEDPISIDTFLFKFFKSRTVFTTHYIYHFLTEFNRRGGRFWIPT